MRDEVARALLPHVEDNGWFFDTELLLLAEHNGLRIHEVPVDWIDDNDSRVHIARTAIGDLRGSARVARAFLPGRGRVELGDLARRRVDDDLGRRLVSFASIGAASTAISLVLFLLWRQPLGAAGANAAAVTATFVANTWLHARVTARLAKPRWLAATAVYLGSLALTSLALLAVHTLPMQLLVLAVTWTIATLARVAALDRRRR